MTPSKRFKLNKEDGIKILKGAGLALGGALLAYASQVLTDTDFGQYTEVVVALGGITINFLYKLLRTE